MYEARYAGRNPLYAMPNPLVDIPVDGPAAEVYRISPDEAWRVIRTKWRVSGLVPGIIEGGGRPSGYFTGATGLTIYTGDALGKDFVDNAFVGDAGSNLVHRKVIRSENGGVGLIAERPKDEEKTEFLRSTDNWFRPVTIANGPDGALYVVDMYREIIEHPWSLPESIKQYLDLHSGVDRGRIWRVVPEGWKRPAPPRLHQASTDELVAALGSPNGWTRETAARLLYQRQDRDAEAMNHPQEALLDESKSPLYRIHFLSALQAIGTLRDTDVVFAMGVPGLKTDARVREHAVLLAEPWLRDGTASNDLWQGIERLASDPDVRVRYRVALTLSEVADPGKRLPALAALAASSAGDPWVRAAILNAAAGDEAALFDRVAAAAASGADSQRDRADLLRQLAALVGVRGKDDEIAVVQRFTETRGADRASGFFVAAALADGLQRAGHRDQIPSRLKPMLDAARQAAADAKAEPATRVEAMGLLGAAGSPDVTPLLLARLDPAESQQIQSAAIAALDRVQDKSIADELVKRLPSLSPKVRSEAIAILLKRPDRAASLLRAMESGTVRPDAVSPTQALALKANRDPAVKALAKKVFGPGATQKREDVINEYLPALALAGHADKGREIYRQRCVSCHRSSGEGFAVGPDFVTIKTAGKEKTLVNILDPNREVAPQYVSYVVDTKAGDTLTGLLVGETAASLTVRQPFGNDTTLLRADVKRIASQNLSLMPEGIEAGMTKQDLADLLEYIATADK
jgi:putative heme-binding domain-containing protein